MRNNPSLITLLIYSDDNQLSTYYDNCAITSLSFSESADTSFCVYPVMTLEQFTDYLCRSGDNRERQDS